MVTTQSGVQRTNLVVVNQGSESTFVVANRQDVLDIVSASYSQLIRNWKISDDCYTSGHKYLTFSIELVAETGTPFLNRSKTKWDDRSKISSILGNGNLSAINFLFICL